MVYTNELKADQKMAKVMLKLRTIRPFYSAIYESMEKIECSSMDSMGVDTDKLYYNTEFIEKTPFSELLFVNLHEIAHVALMHSARQEGRDHTLWNIACDLYVNSALAEEFGLTPDREINIANTRLKMPYNCLYCESLDLNTDYVEKIYNEFDKQAKSNGYYNHSSNNYNTDEYEFSYIGSGSNNSYYGYSRRWKFSITINPENFKLDLLDNGKDQASKMQSARKIVSDAMVKSDMAASGIGSQASNIERTSRKLFDSVIDWKRLLKRYLTTISSKDSSFIRPDRRLFYQEAIYPGLLSDDLVFLNGLKACIDTSGSIGDADLGRFFHQVNTLTKQYKMDAEIIYWDAEVKSAGTFTKYEELKAVKCLGGGGTNPNCIFEYFENNKIVPVITLILTDGLWDRSWVNDKIKRKYKNTIWVLTKNTVNDFKPPFGKKAQITWKEK